MCHMSTTSMPAACIARLAMALNSSSTGSVRQSVLRMWRSAWIGYGVVDTCARAAAGFGGFSRVCPVRQVVLKVFCSAWVGFAIFQPLAVCFILNVSLPVLRMHRLQNQGVAGYMTLRNNATPLGSCC